MRTVEDCVILQIFHRLCGVTAYPPGTGPAKSRMAFLVIWFVLWVPSHSVRGPSPESFYRLYKVRSGRVKTPSWFLGFAGKSSKQGENR